MNLLRTELGVAVQTETGPLPIRHIIGIGRNYAEHAKEQGAKAPTRPMIFTKNPAAACLSGDDIVIPRICQDAASGGDQTDFEGELAVILSRHARDVSVELAHTYILGYTVANDVSARWWQKSGSGGQFFRGKSFDTFCPMGPRVVPPLELRDPQSLRLTTRVNGQTMQDASTAEMIFPVFGLIADLSRGTTLLPGTVILTGTPAGVGMARTPPVWLKHGDLVEVDIQGIGSIKNRVRCE